MTSPTSSEPPDAATRPALRFRGPLELIALAIGALVTGAVLIFGLGTSVRNFEELALGTETTSQYATVDGFPIHCGGLPEAADCLAGYAARGHRPVLVWLGNSQLHAINQLRPGDETAPAILHRELDAQGLDVMAFSLPNANAQEFLVLFDFAASQLPVRHVVVPFVFDDYRETGLRESVASMLDTPGVRDELERSEVGRTIASRVDHKDEGTLAALEGTVQQHSESFLNDWLDQNWSLWSMRTKARGTLFTELLTLRNSFLGITPQSKRRQIPARLELNLAAFTELLDEARRRGIDAITYIAPIRNDVPVPYVTSEYESFKSTAAGIARDHGARFVDLESLVPARYWGSKDATTVDGGPELDFMHFQGPGHRLVAEAIRERLTPPEEPTR